MKAFPTHSINVNDQARVTAIGGEGGMELRDYFAAQALQALIIREGKECSGIINEITTTAYQYADDMMKERQE
jgi:hypothetical protein